MVSSRSAVVALCLMAAAVVCGSEDLSSAFSDPDPQPTVSDLIDNNSDENTEFERERDGITCWTGSQLEQMRQQLREETKQKYAAAIAALQNDKGGCEEEEAKAFIKANDVLVANPDLAQQRLKNDCNVSTMNVYLDAKGPGETVFSDDVNMYDITKSMGTVHELQWQPVKDAAFADADGRNDGRMLSTLGGDLGEWIIAVTAVAAEPLALEQSTMTDLLLAYLKSVPKKKFAYSTDAAALSKLLRAAGVDANITSVSPSQADLLLPLLGKSEFVGSVYLEELVSATEHYNIAPTLVSKAIVAFHQVLWNKAENVSKNLVYTQLDGTHTEKGFLTISAGEKCGQAGLAPAFAQHTCSKSIFVYHSEAAQQLRHGMVSFLAGKLGQGSRIKVLEQKADALAKLNLHTFIESIRAHPVWRVAIN